MSVNLTVNGSVYAYPTSGQAPGWGTVATAWAQAVTQGMLQKSGGTFALTAEVDFGTTYGLKALWFRVRNAAGTFYAGFKGTNLSASVDYELPPNAGTLNQVLTTNGAGALSWTSSALNANGGLPIMDDSAGNATAAVGTCIWAPYLNVKTGHTYTVNGELAGISVDVEGTGAIVVNSGGTFQVVG